ncbi:unnamed protein product [Brassica oleracea]
MNNKLELEFKILAEEQTHSCIVGFNGYIGTCLGMVFEPLDINEQTKALKILLVAEAIPHKSGSVLQPLA